MAELSVASRQDAVLRTLHSLGYVGDLLRQRYPVMTSSGISEGEFVGFGEPDRHDMTTATLVAEVVDHPGSVDGAVARALAAPFRLAATPGALETWSVTSAGRQDELLDTSPYGADGAELPGRLHDSLRPQDVLSAKRGVRQLALFPIDVSLLATARTWAAATLSDRVEEAVDDLLRHRGGGEGRRRLPWAARLVVGALTALMVRDKIDFAQAGVSAASVLTSAGGRFPEHFEWIEGMTPEEREVVLELVDRLGADVNYASLDTSVVSSVYEEAVVSRAARARLGIHYTPFDLARRVAEAVPFEALPPDRRTVLDLACGSGTLLLAAHDRLKALAPADGAASDHEYVRSRLTGYDTDALAVEIAKLSLLLHALPEGDHWQVYQQDALADDGAGEFSVVMTNPPWGQQRSVGGRRYERANEFVEAALRRTAPDGFLAMILPATWLDSNVSRDSRRALTAAASVFEVWRLPEQTFGSAALSPCVILASRASGRRGKTLFRRVLPRGEWRRRFFGEGIAENQYLGDRPADGAGFLSGPLEAPPGLPGELPTLVDVAVVQQGPVPEPPIDAVGAMGGNHLWLREAEAVPPFGSAPPEALQRVRYPEDFHRRIRDPGLFDRPKLLVSSKRATNNPWRLKVGFDQGGLIPRETLYMVAPRGASDDLLWGLFAVLSSSVAACWVDAQSPTLSIPRRALHSLPVPALDDLRVLADVGAELMHSAEAGQPPPPDVIARLETAVWDAYNLADDMRERIRRHLAGFRAPEGRPRFEASVTTGAAPAPARGARRVGATLDIRDDGRLRLWIPGLTSDEGDWVLPPSRFHGWLCAQDSTFDARVVDHDIAGAVYAFQRHTYRDADELAAHFQVTAVHGDQP